jgi:hypothetical protein
MNFPLKSGSLKRSLIRYESSSLEAPALYDGSQIKGGY